MEQSEPEGVDALEERRRDALAETLDAAPIDDEPLDENERAALAEVVAPEDLISVDEYRARRVS